ncbi:MAG TPA: hypothetical protein VFS43_23520 [Polyangiaceae bacterium]|nr:hypothetical protein [Polyangiaceae bacterium]
MKKEVSYEVLEAAPVRTFRFLRAVAQRTEIRSVLEAHGYTPEVHDHGWQLLDKVSKGRPSKPVASNDAVVRKAIAELDAWDERGFRIGHAALAHLHPEQDAFVFEGLEPAAGPEAVLTVSTLLDRLDALESAPEREGTREADHAALETLEKRGITRAERRRLRELVRVARTAVSTQGVGDSPSQEQHKSDLIALHAWFEDWSEMARALIRRRDLLVLLGLARRKRAPKQGGAEAPPATPPAGAPPVVSPPAGAPPVGSPPAGAPPVVAQPPAGTSA